MIRLLQLLLLGHTHKWKVIKSAPMRMNDDKPTDVRGIRYTLQCETCGEIKKRDAF